MISFTFNFAPDTLSTKNTQALSSNHASEDWSIVSGLNSDSSSGWLLATGSPLTLRNIATSISATAQEIADLETLIASL